MSQGLCCPLVVSQHLRPAHRGLLCLFPVPANEAFAETSGPTRHSLIIAQAPLPLALPLTASLIPPDCVDRSFRLVLNIR